MRKASGALPILAMVCLLALAHNIRVTKAEDNLVLEMNVSKTTLIVGEKTDITLTLKNTGQTNVTITFTPPLLDAYYYALGRAFRWSCGRFFINQEKLEFTLEPGQNYSETFQWNLYRYSPHDGLFIPPELGTYNVSGSNYPANTVFLNTQYSIAITVVGIPGDINSDGIVEMMDFYIAGNAYLARPGMSNWNANADINNDGIVEMMDLYVMSQHYLEHT
jgi:hypothetical protein